MNNEIRYINVLGNLYYFINYTIFFFNFVSIVFGSYTFIEQIHNNTLIYNCNSINLFNYIGILNAFLILLTSSCLIEIQFGSFISNIVLSVYNYLNLININKTCMDYYTNTYTKIWLYYLYNIFIQSINNLFYLILFCISIRYICSKSQYKKLNNTTQTDVQTNNNIRIDYGTMTNKQPNLYDDIIDTNELEYNS